MVQTSSSTAALLAGVHENQTEWPPGSPAWLGSPACLVARRVVPGQYQPSAAGIFSAAAKSSLAGRASTQPDRPLGAVLAVDRDPVGGVGDRREAELALRRALAAAVVVGGDRGQSVDRGAGVDGEQGVEAAAAGVDADLGRDRRGPLEPERGAAGIARVVRLAGLLGREAVREKKSRAGRPPPSD